MNLQQLTYFVAVARSRSFTRAAESCFVAQPALSQQVRKLEEELGLPVFERRRTGVSLTVAGTAFLAYAEEALRLVQEGKQRVGDLKDVRKGVVTITCLPSVATYWLPRVVARFRTEFPDVEISIQERAGCTPEEFQDDDLSDLGILQLSEESQPVAEALRVERLFTDEQVLILPADHRLASHQGYRSSGVPLRELADEPFVLPGAGCGMTRTIARAFAEARIQPRVRLQTSQIEAIYEMVAAGLGVGMMPMMALHRSYPEVVWRQIAHPSPHRTIVLVTNNAAALTPAAASFAACLRSLAHVTAQIREKRAATQPAPKAQTRKAGVRGPARAKA